MALTRVRVLLEGRWTELTYNPATGRYEGLVTPPGASETRPGGYYSLTVEATNDSGRTGRLSGEELPALRLVVTDVDAPVLTPVAPPEGYLTTARPTVVMDAADEAMGSGVDPETFTVAVDGAAATEGLAWEEIPGGYRLTYTPAYDLADGPHSVRFSVADHTGNTGAASVAFTVDTVPPAITITLPDSHRLVDEDVILVSGEALDGTSGVAAVSVSAEGGDVPVDVRAGVWAAVVPLEVGRNTVTVTAVDNAALSASRSLTVIRLVTDRGAADVERMRDLFRRGYSRWTEAERTWWANTRCRRGSYDDLDLNRVQMAMAYLNSWLRQYGYLAPGYRAEETVWTEDGQMTRSPGAQYIANVAAFRAALPVPEDTPRPPVSLRGGDFDYRRANDIERILVAVDAVRPKLDMSLWYCGEIYCGEF